MTPITAGGEFTVSEGNVIGTGKLHGAIFNDFGMPVDYANR